MNIYQICFPILSSLLIIIKSIIMICLLFFSERVNDLDTPVMKAMQIFFLENLPENRQDHLATYGEKEIATMCDYFAVMLEKVGCQVGKVIQDEWLKLKLYMHNRRNMNTKDLYKRLFMSSLNEKFSNILTLVEIVLVIPTSSAICERGFSAMARKKSDWRSKLGPEMLDNLMSISINGPPINEYNCASALYRWHNGGQRKRRPKFKSDGVDEFYMED